MGWLGLTLYLSMGSNAVRLCVFWDSGRKDKGDSGHIFLILDAKGAETQAKPHKNVTVLCLTHIHTPSTSRTGHTVKSNTSGMEQCVLCPQQEHTTQSTGKGICPYYSWRVEN